MTTTPTTGSNGTTGQAKRPASRPTQTGPKKGTPADLKSQIDASRNKLRDLGKKVETLKETSATKAEVAVFEARVAELETVLTQQGDRQLDNPIIATLVAEQVEQAKQGIEDLFGDLNTRLTELERTVGDHGLKIADHGARLGMVEEGQASLNQRVSLLERFTEAFPTKRFVISLVIGLVVGLIWNATTFGSTIQNADGSTIQISYEFANSPLGALLAGFVAFAGVFGLSLLFKGEDKTKTMTLSRRQTTTESANQPNSASVPVRMPTASRFGTDPAPTKVFTTSGANSGTH